VSANYWAEWQRESANRKATDVEIRRYRVKVHKYGYPKGLVSTGECEAESLLHLAIKLDDAGWDILSIIEKDER